MNLIRSIVAVGCVVVLISGCGKKADKSEIPLSERKINVVATIGMITDIVQIVGGERVNVSGLMGPGIDPHLYKASEGDMTKMMKADLKLWRLIASPGSKDRQLKSMRKT